MLGVTLGSSSARIAVGDSSPVGAGDAQGSRRPPCSPRGLPGDVGMPVVPGYTPCAGATPLGAGQPPWVLGSPLPTRMVCMARALAAARNASPWDGIRPGNPADVNILLPPSKRGLWPAAAQPARWIKRL